MKTCLENFSYIISTNLHFIFIIVHFKDHGVLSIGFASFSLPFVVIAIVVVVVVFITVSSGGVGPGSSQVESAIMERVFLVLVAVVVMLLKILCIGCSL